MKKKDWNKDVKNFSKRKDLVVRVDTGENGKIVGVSYFELNIPAEVKNKALLALVGIDYYTIEQIFSIPNEELQQLGKLAKIRTMKKEIEKLEAEIK